jgi:hypothetical protein
VSHFVNFPLLLLNFVLRLAPEEPPILIPSMGSVAMPVLLPLSVLLVRPSPRDVLLEPTTPPWA